MIARLLISSNIEKRVGEIKRILASHIPNGNINHPDLMYFKTGEKLGIAEARKIKEHFSLKPYSAKGKVVIIEDSGVLTPEAQNALLKTLEEPPKEAVLILGADSDSYLLPTIVSRCEIILLAATNNTSLNHTKYAEDLNKLLNSTIEERFEYIEKLKDRKEFLRYLVVCFRATFLNSNSSITDAIVQHIDKIEVKNFLEELLRSEEWAKQNVNIRAILEYLMLVMPKIESRV